MISEGQFLIGLLVLLTIGLTVLFYKMSKGEEIPILLLMLMAFASSLLLSIGVFTCVRWVDSDTTEYYSRRANIASIKNSNEVSGSFTLGCGTIEQTEYYYYYYKSVDGYVRGKKPVDKTFIVEDGSDKPHVEIKMTHFESKSGLFDYHDEEGDKYKIVVPKGAVVNKFEVY
jgi:hypothetical protein